MITANGTQQTLGNICNPRNSGPKNSSEYPESPHRRAQERAEQHAEYEADDQPYPADQHAAEKIRAEDVAIRDAQGVRPAHRDIIWIKWDFADQRLTGYSRPARMEGLAGPDADIHHPQRRVNDVTRRERHIAPADCPICRLPCR